MKVFGVANHTPENVVEFLLRGRYVQRASEIGIVPPGERAETSFKYLLILTIRDFSRNFSRLSASDCGVFVFSNPIDLLNFEGIQYADYAKVEEFSFVYGPLSINTRIKSEVRKVKFNFLPMLISSVRHGSLLTPLMTFIYTLSPQNQKVIKLLSIGYLFGSITRKKLISTAEELLTQRALEKLVDILSTSIAESYQAAFAKLRAAKTTPIDKIAAATGTSSYELSYMLSVLSDKRDKYSDSMDKAKNRKVKK